MRITCKCYEKVRFADSQDHGHGINVTFMHVSWTTLEGRRQNHSFTNLKSLLTFALFLNWVEQCSVLLSFKLFLVKTNPIQVVTFDSEIRINDKLTKKPTSEQKRITIKTNSFDEIWNSLALALWRLSYSDLIPFVLPQRNSLSLLPFRLVVLYNHSFYNILINKVFHIIFIYLV